MGNFIDLTGQRFGRLIAIKDIGRHKTTGCALWLCKCDCGCTTTTATVSLRNGSTKSCGCLQKENVKKRSTIHGLAGGHNHQPRLYRTWTGMKARCYNPKASGYKHYGGRGITVCEEWLNYPPFHKWATNHGYKDNLTIDRADNSGNYEPSNCRWATCKEQNLNSRRNHLITYKGETKALAEWSRILSIESSLLRRRLKTWSVEKAFNTPVKKRRQNNVKRERFMQSCCNGR